MEQPEQIYYDLAQRRMNANNYFSAIEALQAIETNYPFGRYAEQAQSELFSKEDELTKLSYSLQTKEEELKLAQEKLDARSMRVAELESIINKKDSIVTALKRSISKALIGLEGEGLTIVQKNGKVYVSLEEDLLFASGKYEVNNTGFSALSKLSSVLASQQDLEILPKARKGRDNGNAQEKR